MKPLFHRFAISFAGVIFVLGCVAIHKVPLARSPATLSVSNWDQVVAEVTEEFFRINPDRASAAGRHEFDGLLPDWSQEGRARSTERIRKLQRIVADVAETGLTEEQKFQRKYLLFGLKADLFWRETSGSMFDGIDFYRHSFEIFHLAYGEYAPLEQRQVGFSRFARSLARACQQIRNNIRVPMAEELRAHSEQVVRGLVDFFNRDAKKIFSGVANAEFFEASRLAIAALDELADFFKIQKGKATRSFALGEEKFRQMLAEVDGVTVPLAEIKRAGLEDLRRNQSNLKKWCDRFEPEKSVAQCVESATSEKPDDILKTAQEQLVELESFLKNHDVVTIPSDEKVMVRETPSYLRWNTASLRSPGVYDRGLPSAYFIAPPDPSWTPDVQKKYLKSKWELWITSAHEVWPGHFLHTLHDNLRPPILGRIFRAYSTVEGWAHYTEEMMVELGLGDDDPRIHIAQIKWALLRNARMLSAIGLHTEGWSREQSEQFFRDEAYANSGLAKQQSMRGVFDPDFLGYSLGKLMVLKLREDWTKTRGGRKAWRAFHDQFVSYGNAPVPLIRTFMLGNDSGMKLF
jgi:uncharacterized protein (DUF885 family)